ncbi:ATP-binding cassette domain-containing protein [Myxococcota bacterium]|nr:ATP-binding cassette domain-containing protein [Myxococcota bacterium]
MITVTDLSRRHGMRTLFEQANLQLNAGSRYGIVGANGSGKSTLLRILASQESASGGSVQMPRNARVGVLEQDHFQYEDARVLDVVMMGNPMLWAAMVQQEELLANAHERFDDDRYMLLEDIILANDGYTLEARAGAILEGLGIPTAQHERPLRELSGGYKLRVLLGQTLAANPDVLLLDEPTNHLDILAIRWLEEFLGEYRGCAAIVSHDHRFLDTVCTHIVDVDYERVTMYPGTYADFEERKAEDRERLEAEIAGREKEIADHKAFVARFKAKASKARQAQSRQKRIERIVIEDLPRSSRRYPGFRFKARRQSGRLVLKVQGLGRDFGPRTVLDQVSFEVHRGDRVAIIGPNGIGKSTLLKILVGALPADRGSFEWGHEVDLGYFPQDHRDALGDPDQTVSSALWEVCPREGLGAIMGRLAAVLFTRDDADQRVGNLSGGEAARLLFARIGAPEPTVLVLDEPTNHLDLEGIEALAAALSEYDGTIVFVSHDRWFVDQLATRVIAVGPRGIDDYPGTYAEYLARDTVDHLDRAAVVAAARRERARS